MRLFIIAILSLVFTSCATNKASSPDPQFTSAQRTAMEKKILAYVNEYRRSKNICPLLQDEQYVQISRQHSERMLRANDMNHKGFSQRTKAVQKNSPRALIAENVAFNYGYSTPERHVVDSWINSSGHRVNIIGNYRYTGIGVAESRDGKIYYSQLFVNR